MAIIPKTTLRKKPAVRRLLLPSLLAVLRNSVGAKIWRTYYVESGGKKINAMQDGSISCAFFISSVLLNFGLIKAMHGTVDAVVMDLQKSGWKRARRPRPGAIIVWPAIKHTDGSLHKHIGCYLGNDKAVSNSTRRRAPALHHWTYGTKDKRPRRKIEAIYVHEKLKNA